MKLIEIRQFGKQLYATLAVSNFVTLIVILNEKEILIYLKFFSLHHNAVKKC